MSKIPPERGRYLFCRYKDGRDFIPSKKGFENLEEIKCETEDKQLLV